ncbi:MAG: holo-ACP synthase [Limnochordia bacterium]
MTFGIGVDVVDLPRIAKVLERFPQRFPERILSPREMDYCQRGRNFLGALAGRFAAKEAVMKALGVGLGQGISWQDIEILNENTGRPVVYLHGGLKTMAAKLGVGTILISISHGEVCAVAQALALRSGVGEI